MASIIKPHIRTVHPKLKPGLSNILLSAIGKMTPPRDEPATAMPIAAPRFSLKYCDVAAIPGAIVALIGIVSYVGSVQDINHHLPHSKTRQCPLRKQELII